MFNKEQSDIFAEYINILKKWQKTINLVSNSTIDNVLERHILDSAQLLDYITVRSGLKIADIGSGAGFPGMVLAILNKTNEYNLIEIDQRKCSFLNYIKAELKVDNVNIINKRIEQVIIEAPNSFDVITSRALARLDVLLDYSTMLLKDGGYSIFLKGNNYEEEMALLDKEMITKKDIKIHVHDSATDPNSKIIVIN